MAEKQFLKSEALQFGYDTLKKNFGFLVGVTALAVVCSFAIPVLSTPFRNLPVIPFIFTIANFAFNSLIMLGLIKISLNIVDGQDVKVADLFSGMSKLLPYIGGSILNSLAVLVGFILLIVPGIVVSIMFMFFAYFMIDKDSGPIEALKRSAMLADGVKWNLFLFLLLIFGINIIGMLVLLVGLLVTVPLSMLATAYVYRKLVSQAEEGLDTQSSVSGIN